MKKLTALVLSVGMIFSIAACSSSKVNDKALDTLESSIQKFAELKSASYSIAMDVEADKEKANLKLYGDFIATTAKPEISATLDMEASGEKVEKYMQIFLKDDTVYMNMLGLTKQKTSLNKMMGNTPMPEIGFDSDTFKLNKDDMKPYLKEASIKGNDLKLVLNTTKINEEANKNETTSKAKIEFKTFDMDVTLKDGFMEKAVITMDMKGASTGSEIQEVKGTITLEFKNINNIKEIAYPDFKDYKEEK